MIRVKTMATVATTLTFLTLASVSFASTNPCSGLSGKASATCYEKQAVSTFKNDYTTALSKIRKAGGDKNQAIITNNFAQQPQQPAVTKKVQPQPKKVLKATAPNTITPGAPYGANKKSQHSQSINWF